MSLTYVVECHTTKDEALGVARVAHMYDSRGNLTNDRLAATSIAAQLPDGMWVSSVMTPDNIHPLQ